ncbi:MAG: hypothetical protein QOE45_3121 [Frankiaceae bacterium]|jgi:hypothetical protein|nr:hypothetical protein [Frankiaceae bacterium]
MFRRARNVLAVALLAAGAVTAAAGTASAEALPQSPYCFTVDGSGVCIVLTLQVTPASDPINTGDLTATASGQVGFYCPGKTAKTCQVLATIVPFEIGRSGLVLGNPTIGTRHVADLRVPQVCVPGGCVGPYIVPVDVPIVNDAVPEVWLDGGNPLDVSTCLPCQLSS